MASPSANQRLYEFLRAKGVMAEHGPNGVSTQPGFRFDAHWVAGDGGVLCVEVRVFHSELFPNGVMTPLWYNGEDREEAESAALELWFQVAMRPLHDALGDSSLCERMSFQTTDGRTFVVFLGPVVRLAGEPDERSDSNDPADPSCAFTSTLRSMPLPTRPIQLVQVHVLRLEDGRCGSIVHVDGVRSTALDEALQAWASTWGAAEDRHQMWIVVPSA